MNANNANSGQTSGTTSAAEPTGPPVDPAERPTIEPTDALPTEENNEPGLVEAAKTFFGDETPDEDSQRLTATSAAEPTPPLIDPAERPRIEPTDALPTDEK